MNKDKIHKVRVSFLTKRGGKMQKFKTEFYQIDTDPNTILFETLLGQIDALPLRQRNFTMNGVPFRLQEYNVNGTEVSGDLVRIRMDTLPVKAALGGQLQAINLAADEGIGEETAFVYKTDTSVLALQRNRMGMSAYRFAEYVERITNRQAGITPLPILKRAVNQRLQRARTIRSVKCRFLRPTNQHPQSVGGVIDAMENVGAATISLELSMGHQRGSLIRAAVTNLIREAQQLLRPDNREAIQSIKVAVKDGDNDPGYIIDMIKDTLVDERNLGRGHRRHLTYTARLEYLRAALTSQATDLRDVVHT